MKKLLFSLGLVLLLIPATVLAAEFKSSQNGPVSLGAKEQSNNLYIAGQMVSIDGNVSKDLVAAGSSVAINGNVENSILALGSTVSVKGNVGDNLRVAGSDVTVSGNVGGDALVAGSNVTVSNSTIINGDLLAAAETLTIAGDIHGNVTGTGSSVTITGKVNGNVNLTNVSILSVGSSAVITGKLTYSSSTQANIDRNAVITGGVDYTAISTPMTGAWGGAFVLIKILGSFIFLLFLIYLLPKSTRKFVETASSDLWSNLGWGFLILITLPIASMILLSLVAPAGIAFVFILVYIIAIILSCVMASLLIGSTLHKALKKEKEFRIDWLTALFGVAVASLLYEVPVLGALFVFLAFLVSFGTFARLTGQYIEYNRK
ncbi:MAG: hypothetical protein Q7S80_02350 [bacterium]|nr:hypothetical protein [bacterium]